MSVATHTCPAPGCATQVPNDMLACRIHWFRIPGPLRTRLWVNYREHGMGSPQHLAAVEACCEWLRENLRA